MFIVKQLDSAGSILYESLTFSYTRPLMKGLDHSKSHYAIGAEWVEGAGKAKAVGLIIIHRPEGSAAAEVVSIFVKAGFRRRGIGAALLREGEQLLQVMGCSKLSFIYYSEKAITPALESFLHREGWSEPALEGRVYRTNTRIAEAPWIRKTGMPSGMQSFYWHEISDQEKARLSRLQGSLYPAFLSPFKEKLLMEESNSLGLRVHGETVGWCITYRIAEDTLLYDSVYITPEYQLSGCAFMLVAQAISIQLEGNLPNAMFAVNNQAPFMRKMLDRWLAPYATGISERKAAYKDLSVIGG